MKKECLIENFYKYKGGIIYLMTYYLKKNANDWNYILNKLLGYDYIQDDHFIIHMSETQQTVFLTSNSFECLEVKQNDYFLKKYLSAE